VLIEKVTLSLVFEQAMLADEETRWLPVIEVALEGNKEQRLGTLVAWARRRKLYIDQTLTWVKQLKTELINFGTYKHDDCVDPLTLFFKFRGFEPAAAQLHVLTSVHFL
jgi:hypothetical protein